MAPYDLGLDAKKFCRGMVLRTNHASFPHDYTGSNPPYITKEAIEWFAEKQVEHILIDLPSVDREECGRGLLVHSTFWAPPSGGASSMMDEKLLCRSTITELCSVPGSATDGLYMLSLQIAPLDMDVAPSRPVLYPVLKE